MAPRKASAASKAAPDAKAAASTKTSVSKKSGATAPAKKQSMPAPKAAKTAKGDKAEKAERTEKGTTAAAKRKRSDDEAALKENGVSATTKPAPKKAAEKKTKTDSVDSAANKENAAPLTNGNSKRKRVPVAAKPIVSPAKAKAKSTKRKASDVEDEEEHEEEEKEHAEARPAKAARKTKEATAGKAAAAEKAAAEAEKTATAAAAAAAAAAATATIATEAATATEATATSTTASAAAAVKRPTGKIGVKINQAPTQPLDVFVFGEGGAGELGLGSVRVEGKKPMDVKRPRLNHNLAAGSVGVVQIAAGGMHAVALTKDNKILTWGVNDQGALGRNTSWDGGLRDADAEEDSDDDDDTGLNPLESTPAEIDTAGVIKGTKFVQVVASDSASFALTEDGRIYGWGTFRASDGVLGFSRDVSIQRTPALLPEPKKVKALATGSNHILALDVKGKLFTWGCPEQNQLGRRCVQRDIRESALRPGGVGFRRGVHIERIACGSYHSFAVDDDGRVYAWGLNNFGQLNVEQGAGDTDATVLDATLVEGLADHKVVDVDGGEHHSLACTADGKLLTWGRIDGHQVGFEDDAFNSDNAIFDEHGKPRILKEPTVVPDIPPVVNVNAGTDNSFALTADGKVFSWGFSGTYQTGQGTTEDIETPTLIDNTAVRDKKILYASAGGQFSLLASAA